MTGDRGVLVVCTGSGEHKPVKVARFVIRGDKVALRPAVDPNRDTVDRYGWDADATRNGVVELKCVRCGRNARRTVADLAPRAAALAEGGFREVELSALQRF